MPGLVETGLFSSGQGCPVRSGWSEQDGHVGPVMSGQFWSGQVRSGQSSFVGLVRSGQVRICQFRSGQFRLVRSGHVMSVQVRSIRSY